MESARRASSGSYATRLPQRKSKAREHDQARPEAAAEVINGAVEEPQYCARSISAPTRRGLGRSGEDFSHPGRSLPTMAMADTYEASKADLEKILRTLKSTLPIPEDVWERWCSWRPVRLPGSAAPPNGSPTSSQTLRGYALEALLGGPKVTKDSTRKLLSRSFAQIMESNMEEHAAADLLRSPPGGEWSRVRARLGRGVDPVVGVSESGRIMSAAGSPFLTASLPRSFYCGRRTLSAFPHHPDRTATRRSR